jgi:hypothetical protein
MSALPPKADIKRYSLRFVHSQLRLSLPPQDVAPLEVRQFGIVAMGHAVDLTTGSTVVVIPTAVFTPERGVHPVGADRAPHHRDAVLGGRCGCLSILGVRGLASKMGEPPPSSTCKGFFADFLVIAHPRAVTAALARP